MSDVAYELAAVAKRARADSLMRYDFYFSEDAEKLFDRLMVGTDIFSIDYGQYLQKLEKQKFAEVRKFVLLIHVGFEDAFKLSVTAQNLILAPTVACDIKTRKSALADGQGVLLQKPRPHFFGDTLTHTMQIYEERKLSLPSLIFQEEFEILLGRLGQ